MKREKTSKGTKDKKEPKEQKDKKETKSKVKEPEPDSEEYYTKEEIEQLDRYHEITENKFEDDEIYEVMQKFNNDDSLIINELKEMMKVTLRGEEYSWQEIGKSNYIII